MSEIKIRWFLRFCFVIVGILARREIGTSQHLRIMRGAERVSVARDSVKWCQVEEEWGKTEKSLKKDMRMEKRIEIAQRCRGWVIHGSGMERVVKSRMDIINGFLFGSVESTVYSFEDKSN